MQHVTLRIKGWKQGLENGIWFDDQRPPSEAQGILFAQALVENEVL